MDTTDFHQKYVDRREAAKIAGISLSTFGSHQHPGKAKRKSPLPEPALRIAGSPLWLREDIIQWAAQRDKKPGFPGKADSSE